MGDQELLWSIPQVVKGERPALGEVLDQTLTVVQHHVVRAKDVELFWLKTANVIHTACQTVFTLEICLIAIPGLLEKEQQHQEDTRWDRR